MEALKEGGNRSRQDGESRLGSLVRVWEECAVGGGRVPQGA